MKRTWANPYKILLRGLLFAWLCAALTLPCGASSELSMALDDGADSVIIAGLEPGAEVVFYRISRFSSGFVPRVERHVERLIADGDGEIHVALERQAPPKFLAVAVALESGHYEVLTPPGSPVRAAPPAASLLDPSGSDRLEEAESYVEYFLTRPRVGAWALSAGDGTPADQSPASDGIARTFVSDMVPVGASPSPPPEYEAGDLLVRVAPTDMEYYVLRIER